MARVVLQPCASAVVLLFCVLCCISVVSCAGHQSGLDTTLVDPSWPNADQIPPLELIVGQNFAVSVMTRSFGVFNATLRMHSSPTFPERIHGELIPRGEPVLSMADQHVLPHFTRMREVEDDQMSETFSGSSSSSRLGGVESAVQRPTLLSIDIKLQNSDSPLAQAKVYHIPADVDEMQKTREQMQEGVAQPTVTANVHVRMDSSNHSMHLLSDVPALIRSASCALQYGSKGSHVAEAGGGAAQEAARAGNGVELRGSFTIYFFSEHEFSASLLLPMGEGSSGTLEPIWLYGYTVPTGLMSREESSSFLQKYGLICMSLFGFVLQVIIGILTPRAAKKQKQSAKPASITAATSAENPSAALAKKES